MIICWDIFLGVFSFFGSRRRDERERWTRWKKEEE
jgi:hypothetical protein